MGVHYYKIGGITIKIASDIELPITANPLFKKFTISPRKADAKYSFSPIEDITPAPGRLTARETRALRRTVNFPERWLANPVLLSPCVRLAIRDCLPEPELCHLSLSWNRVIIRNFSKNKFHFFYFPKNSKEIADPLFAARFRNMLGLSFIQDSSILVHGAGITRKRKAALFLAPDEGGKTTLARKFAHREILGDDQIVLHREKDRFFLSSNPFGSISCGPATSRLAGIFLVRKSKKFALRPAKANEVLRFIWNESSSRLLILPKPLRLRAFEILCKASRNVPTFHLHAPLESMDIDAIDDAMAN